MLALGAIPSGYTADQFSLSYNAGVVDLFVTVPEPGTSPILLAAGILLVFTRSVLLSARRGSSGRKLWLIR